MKANRCTYRGKRVDTGEWVEGFYVLCPDRNTPLIFTGNYTEIQISSYPEVLSRIEWDRCQVDPATVGQSTGLTDMTGKEIFEGDVVRFSFKGKETKQSYWYPESVIKAGTLGFDVVQTKGPSTDNLTFAVKYWANTKVEVIGNIHENPELLEEQPQ